MTAQRAGRPQWWVAGLVLCVGAIALGYFLWSAPQSAVLPPQARPTDGAASREDAAAELLTELTDALMAGDRSAVVALAAGRHRPARAELGDLADNVRKLRVADLSMRYLDENAGRHVRGMPARIKERAWVADVELSWRLSRLERTRANIEIAMTFVQTKDGASFVTARRTYGHQAPLWMLDRLAVARAAGSLVMAAGGRGEAREYSAMATQAVRDVRKVLPRWRGGLVVEVPDTQRDLERILASDSSYGAIAAVTAPVDGSLSPSAPTHIFINPPVFEPLGAQGSQIVMSHEAAHVATDAAISGMPTWLLEGFADYVALARSDLVVEVTASQILAQVKRDGPPRRLPTERDFESENQALGASYEAAWLACRLIAQRYGEKTLIEFYDRADRDSGTDAAFREVLGISEGRLTELWRAELRSLAT